MGVCAFSAISAAVLSALTILPGSAGAAESAADGAVVKTALDVSTTGPNLLQPDGWRPWEKGFRAGGRHRSCATMGRTGHVQRGASQTVVLEPDRAGADRGRRLEQGRTSDRIAGRRLRPVPGPGLRGRHAAVGPDRAVCHGHPRLAVAAGGGGAREAGPLADAFTCCSAVTAARPGFVSRRWGWSVLPQGRACSTACRCVAAATRRARRAFKSATWPPGPASCGSSAARWA